MDFIRYWTHDNNRGSYDHSMCYTTRDGMMMLVDTPTDRNRRTLPDYSVDGIFKIATMILNFGDWKITEVEGSYAFPIVPIMTASSDPEETLRRILIRHGVNVSLVPLVVSRIPRGIGVVGDRGSADAEAAPSAGTQ